MGDLLKKVKDRREAILLGEIGALLHMFGKCSSGFLVANSQEGGAQDRHTQLDWMSAELKSCLENQKLTDVLVFPIDARPEKLAGDFTDFITKYKGSGPDSVLLRLFNACHRMTSADEKGVVRRKQSKQDMWITTPFGYGVHELDLDVVDTVRMKMDSDLAKVMETYLNGTLDIDGLHDQAVAILKEGMSQALGETRQPANDVTLWAQSHGVASLYKPVLATLPLNLDPCPRKGNGELDYNNVRWRLLGIGWNGLGFVQRGRKPGDILRRREILQDISVQLQRLLEVQYPVGNLFYEDLNGLFFTFPGLEGQEETAEALARELAPEIVEIVRGQSDTELWPFFTLSKPRRTLTTITHEIEARDGLAALPRVAALLSLERDGDQREEKLIVDSPTLSPPAAGQDICPVCQFRSKQQRKDACQVCRDRRSGRQVEWQRDRQGQTIWIDEVADRNNRLALLTLRFDLSRWLNGEWLATIYSQAVDDWGRSTEFRALAAGNISNRVKSFASGNGIPTLDLAKPTMALAADIASLVLKSGNPGVRAPLLQSFFVSNDVSVREDQNSPNYVERHLENFASRLGKDRNGLTPDELVENCFTQNPSPPRLRRIWEATESFLDSFIQTVESKVFAARPQRLCFKVATPLPWVQAQRTYRITVPGLKPATLTVLCLDTGQNPAFSTVASLEHFHFADDDHSLNGPSAVEAALKVGGISEWRDDETGQSIAGATSIPGQQVQGFASEEYLPFIVLSRSPAFCQLLLPAERTPDVLRQLLNIVDQHFGKVQGKLPLQSSLLVVNRRFPLYALLEAGQMALDHESLSKGLLQHPWWDVTAHARDPFFGSYPTKPSGDGKWALTDLSPVDQGDKFWMTPGYFDFDLLGSTADRHNLIYEEQDGRLVRSSIVYGTLRPRPIILHRLRDQLQIWEILTKSLGPTQRHHLEEALTSKLEGWKAMDWNQVRPVFETFGIALLQRTFGKDKWSGLNPKGRSLLEHSLSNGLLLEALELFQHVVKEETPNG